jgi:DNA (cytosine-5)-methyltransferase 3A
MNAVSLFDGISCGRIAFERANISIERYVAYEIEPNAIKVSTNNYPQIEHCGDVTKADFNQYKGFDFLIGGSPCQNMSTLGDRQGLKGKESSLFYEYARALKEMKPKYFLLENNANMPKEAKAEITKILGVNPIEINSSLFLPQNRNRFYWVGKRQSDGTYTTIDIPLENKRTKTLKDILCDNHTEIKLSPFVVGKIPLIIEKYGYLPEMFNPYNKSEITDIHPCLTCNGNSQTTSSSAIIRDGDKYYLTNSIEWERLQGLPDNYTSGVTESQRKNLAANGWTVDVIAYIFSFITMQND